MGALTIVPNWDAIARELQPHFHIMAPDLRGHAIRMGEGISYVWSIMSMNSAA